jgi:hypothetical protein
MTHKLIKTDNYLLVVDDSEIKVGDFCYDEEADPGHNNQKGVTKCLRTASDSYWNKHCKKIVYHLPLNNVPTLKGVPLLPPLEDDVHEIGLKKYPIYPFYDGDELRHSDTNDELREGFIEGYNKAKEKYKYTEEDLRKCWKACLDFNKPAGGDSGINLEDFIQSIQQPKMPVAFECEEIYCGYMEDEALMKPKTTTNPQDQTVLAGKYIY